MTPKLSVIIVSYHATPLNILCLWALEQNNLKESEVIIVDNTGHDLYLEQLAQTYPFVKIIRNNFNEGFGRACNKGYNIAQGEYILFLNPDTIVPLNIEKKIFSFFKDHPGTGAMGVRMTDGTGCFLPESKRNFPYPLASFLKISGLQKLISPQNLKLNYYARHVADDATAKVDVLSGAFLVVTREAMEKTGGFDPRFFLFAEDIDISIRISKAGCQLWYNPDIEIIHFKGHSTRQSKKYASYFYDSMKLFYLKYFEQSHTCFQKWTITTFIRTMAFLSSLRHFFKRQIHPRLPSTFYIDSKYCTTSAIYELQTLGKYKFISTTNNHKKIEPTHLLLSEVETNPDELIKQVNNKKTRILFWHKSSGWLFHFDGKNGKSSPVINTKIK
ncbi:glycosyltransferase family 2 protein [Anaerophaga thermohalophila]|uniref:glycosyltransferase family 2 protein n=1 Tax=Anaerophaga thermohalophila TaxID=177400 RepID=UPI000237D3F2|nr:glycosyltransferase family 2 protein [Anaerophaga thermohalophila]